MLGCRGKVGATLLTDTCVRLGVAETLLGSVVPVPFAASVGPVPRHGERPDSLEVGLSCGCTATFPAALAVSVFVLGDGEADEVAGVVVERIEVCVVNLAASRDRTVNSLPDLFMEPSDAVETVGVAGDEVVALRPLFRVRIAPEDDAVEPDSLHVDHETSLSPYRSASIRMKSRSCVQTG